MATAADVQAVSQRFYSALRSVLNGDASLMADAWEQGSDVSAIHPIGSREVNWENVANSFVQVASAASDGRIELKERRVVVTGDLALETGIEHVSFKLGDNPVETQVRVTNVYRLGSDGWKMIHHHADASPELQTAAERLGG